MDRRRFLLTSLAGALAAPLAVEAQQQGKVWSHHRDPVGRRQGGAASVVVAELIRLQVDLIVSSAAAATRAAKEATTTIPIVLVTVADPVAFGFVQRGLSRPGGNLTGFAFMHPKLSGKRLELLKAAVPKLTRLAVLWNGANPYKAADMKEVQIAADASGVTLQSLPVKEPQDLERAFAKQGRADALITLEDPFTIAHRIRIVELTRTHRLPACTAEEFTWTPMG